MTTRIFLLFVVPQSTNAAQNNSSFLNGKPFSALNEAIQENAASIGELESYFSALQATVDSILLDIADLDSRITANQDAINQALNDISLLGSDLAALRQTHEEDLADINIALVDLQTLIQQTQLNLDAAVASLQQQLADLEAATGADIDALVLKTTSLMGDVIVLNNTLQDQQTLISSLQNSQSDLEDMVAGLEVREAALEGRVSTLEAFHRTTPEQCDAGNDRSPMPRG
jgi:chromosome segregation ATPase